MTIHSATIRRRDGAYVLEVDINGALAILSDSQDHRLYEKGLIFLGEEFEGIVPDIDLEPDWSLNLPAQTLKGYTSDLRIRSLYERYLAEVEPGGPGLHGKRVAVGQSSNQYLKHRA